MAPSFWGHSYKARRLAEAKQEKREREHQQKVIAQAALAGWRFERHEGLGGSYWGTWAPDGTYHGVNTSLVGAATYALHVLEGRL